MTEKSIEIDCLKKEICQLKQDKEFVWNLWKRLQLSSPDLTNAMNLVVQRETERSEKEKNEILKENEVKSQNICKLENILEAKDRKICELTGNQKKSSERIKLLEKHCSNLTEKAEKLSYFTESRDTHENESKQRKEQQKLIDNYEEERREMLGNVSRLQSTISALTDEKNSLRLQMVALRNEIDCEWRARLQEAETTIKSLRVQLVDIDELQETIGRLEQELESRNVSVSVTNYDDIRSVIESHQDSDRPITPVQDLNYKVDRLSLHMGHLEQYLGHRVASKNNSASIRSKSIPPKLPTQQKEELNRKVQFLTQKLTKTQTLLDEEKKTSSSTTDFLQKANNRVKSLQITVKQLRKQCEDCHETERKLQQIKSQLEEEVDKYKKKIKSQNEQLENFQKNSIFDATRIQDILITLEKTRTEMTAKSLENQSEQEMEIVRLRDLVHCLENEKCGLEATVRRVQEKLQEMENKCAAALSRPAIELKLGKVKKFKTTNKRTLSRRNINKKTKNMKTILSHFSGENSLIEENEDSDVNKREENEEGEEVEEGDEDENEEDDDEEFCNNDNKYSGRSSSDSIGGKVVRLTKKYSSNHKSRNSLVIESARQKHVERIRGNLKLKLDDDDDENKCNECVKLKHRINGIRQQVKTVVNERDQWRLSSERNGGRLPQLTSELMQVRARCKRLSELSKNQSIKLNILKRERKQLLMDENEYEDIIDELNYGQETSQQHHQQYQQNVIKEMQKEMDLRDVEIKQMRMKITRLEREISNKRKLIEDQRSRLSVLDVGRDAEKTIINEKDRKLKEIEESCHKWRIQYESLQARMTVLLEERKKWDMESSTIYGKAEQSERKVAELRQSNRLLELQMSRVDREMEQRLSDIVRDNAATLDKTSSQIQRLKNISTKYEQLIISLARVVADKTREIHRLLHIGTGHYRITGRSNSMRNDNLDKSLDNPDISVLEIAKSRAANILSLTSDEMDSLMSPGSSCQGNNNNYHSDREFPNATKSIENSNDFVQTCKKALKKDCFDTVVYELVSDKLNEMIELMIPQTCYDSGCTSN